MKKNWGLLPVAFLSLVWGTARARERPSAGGGVVSLSTSVFITSNSMLVIQQGRQLKFTGHVKATHGHDRLTSDELLSDKPKQILYADGHVTIYRTTTSDQVWEAFGEHGTYSTQTSSMTLWNTTGRSRLIRHLKDSPLNTVELEAQWMETDGKLSFAHGRGDAYGKSISTSTVQSMEFWSEDATYDENHSLIDLQGGHPLVILEKPSETRRINGQRIRYFIDAQKLLVEGNGVSQIFPKKTRSP